MTRQKGSHASTWEAQEPLATIFSIAHTFGLFNACSSPSGPRWAAAQALRASTNPLTQFSQGHYAQKYLGFVYAGQLRCYARVGARLPSFRNQVCVKEEAHRPALRTPRRRTRRESPWQSSLSDINPHPLVSPFEACEHPQMVLGHQLLFRDLGLILEVTLLEPLQPGKAPQPVVRGLPMARVKV